MATAAAAMNLRLSISVSSPRAVRFWPGLVVQDLPEPARSRVMDGGARLPEILELLLTSTAVHAGFEVFIEALASQLQQRVGYRAATVTLRRHGFYDEDVPTLELTLAVNDKARTVEIGPGGFTSLEQHVHEHAVFVLRGRGQVRLGDSSHDVRFGDLVYVSPREPPGLQPGGPSIGLV